MVPKARPNRSKLENKIVSPVVPQPGGGERRRNSGRGSSNALPSSASATSSSSSSIKSKQNVFRFGNYNQYYGYRNGRKTDPRLELLRREWFTDKEILDIGCNIGHVSLSIGRDCNPVRVVGVDIDRTLIKIATKNARHYQEKHPAEKHYPNSLPALFGPLDPPIDKNGRKIFPHNVKFIQVRQTTSNGFYSVLHNNFLFQANYVLENDALLEAVRPEFDTILCLSVSKWIHLNFGDEGLKRFFKRIYLNLKHKGIFVFEPQGWPSYTKKKKLTVCGS